MPRVSVIIPTYNRREYVQEAMPALRILLISVVFVLTLTCLGQPSLAQGDEDTWEGPVFLTPDPEGFRIRPWIAADGHGNLHVLWHTRDDGQPGDYTVHAVYYAVWDGQSWSEPLDILAVPLGAGRGIGQVRSFVATPDGLLLALYTQEGRVMLARAAIEEAIVARAWSMIPLDQGSSPTLAVSVAGDRWYVTYVADAATALLVTCSDDQGLTWDNPHPIWTAPPQSAANNVESLVSQDGRLQLVWTENAARRNWNGEAIWHAAYDPVSGTALAREVARSARPEDPNIDQATLAECPNGQLHLFWNNGAGSQTGRFHQWHDPQTQIWSPAKPLFPGLSGLTSKAGLVCDSANRVHLITAAGARGASAPGYDATPLFYATWFSGEWSGYTVLWGGKYGGERPSVTILMGNQLHLVWDAFVGMEATPGRFIAYGYRPLDLPASPREPAPVAATRAVAMSHNPTPSATPMPTMSAVLSAKPADLHPPTGAERAAAGDGLCPILLGGGTALAILGIALGFSRRRDRR